MTERRRIRWEWSSSPEAQRAALARAAAPMTLACIEQRHDDCRGWLWWRMLGLPRQDCTCPCHEGDDE